MTRLALLITSLWFLLFPCKAQRRFTHPGILHTKADLEQIKRAVKEKEKPAYSSFLLLCENKLADADYRMQGPFDVIARDGDFRYTKRPMEEDFGAAYLNALMWICTDEEAHARKTLEILTAYAEKLKLIPDTNDGPLLAGIEGYQIVYAAEILQYTYDGMTAACTQKIKNMMNRVFLPVMEKFFDTLPYTNGNWGALINKTYMAIAIYLDNADRYQRALDFYLNGWDNGTIRHYVSGKTGQIQESGRDQVHSMMGVGALATTCELAWKQGDDLYSALDNRLLKGMEYLAKYNLGLEVPFETWIDVTGKYSSWTAISEQGRGRVIPIYVLPYHHYVHRKQMRMPYTQKMIKKQSPEGYDGCHPGFGELLHK